MSSSWGGSMTVVVTNQTGGDITAASAAHSWKASNTSVGPQSLGAGDTMSFQITVGSGSSDLWSVGFTDAGGNTYYRNGKQCNVEESDFDTGSSIYINLLPPSTGWSVELPSSSSCPDNFYHEDSASDVKDAKPAAAPRQTAAAS